MVLPDGATPSSLVTTYVNAGAGVVAAGMVVGAAVGAAVSAGVGVAGFGVGVAGFGVGVGAAVGAAVPAWVGAAAAVVGSAAGVVVAAVVSTVVIIVVDDIELVVDEGVVTDVVSADVRAPMPDFRGIKIMAAAAPKTTKLATRMIVNFLILLILISSISYAVRLLFASYVKP